MMQVVFFRTLVLAALFAPAVALTLIVRRSDQLPGEATLTRWLADETGWPGDMLGEFLELRVNYHISLTPPSVGLLSVVVAGIGRGLGLYRYLQQILRRITPVALTNGF